MGKMFTLASTGHLAATGTASGGNYTFLIIIVVLFGLFYFVMIRPQRNRQRQVQQMQSQIGPGQKVRTTAGMYATVISVEGDDVLLEVAPGVKVRYMRRAIMDVVPGDTDGATEAADGEDTAAEDAAEDAVAEHTAAGDATAGAPEPQTAQAGKPGAAENGTVAG